MRYDATTSQYIKLQPTIKKTCENIETGARPHPPPATPHALNTARMETPAAVETKAKLHANAQERPLAA